MVQSTRDRGGASRSSIELPHQAIRRDFGCILWITGVGGVGLTIEASRSLPSIRGAAMLALGVAYIGIAVGVWRAQEWARWAAGLIALFYCVAAIIVALGSDPTHGTLTRVAGLCTAVVMVVIAVYAILPSTRRRFRDARDALEGRRRSVGPE